jgi:toxin YoeB
MTYHQYAHLRSGLVLGVRSKQPPPFEQLIGDLKGPYSRRINIRHRLVYQVLSETRSIKILRMWSHYE